MPAPGSAVRRRRRAGLGSPVVNAAYTFDALCHAHARASCRGAPPLGRRGSARRVAGPGARLASQVIDHGGARGSGDRRASKEAAVRCEIVMKQDVAYVAPNDSVM